MGSVTTRTDLFRLEEMRSRSSGRDYLVGFLGNAKVVVKCEPGEKPRSPKALNLWHATMQPYKGKSFFEPFELIKLQEFLSKHGRPYLSGRFGDAWLVITPDETLKPKSDRGQAVWRAFLR